MDQNSSRTLEIAYVLTKSTVVIHFVLQMNQINLCQGFFCLAKVLPVLNVKRSASQTASQNFKKKIKNGGHFFLIPMFE